MPKFVPRSIVLTGVSRGLGLAMAEGFIAAGHTVRGCARDPAAISALTARFPAPHQFAAVDVADDAQVAAWAQRVMSDGFVPDLLINNAALINRNAVLWKVPAEEFSRLVDVNIEGVANCIRHFVPPMVARKQGVVVNFSSGWGRSTSPEVGPYCATKWAIEGMSFALSQELPRGMCAVPLNPGIIQTDMLQSCFGASAAHYPTAQEWAKRAVPYLLSLGRDHNGEAVSVP